MIVSQPAVVKQLENPVDRPEASVLCIVETLPAEPIPSPCSGIKTILSPSAPEHLLTELLPAQGRSIAAFSVPLKRSDCSEQDTTTCNAWGLHRMCSEADKETRA